MAKQPAPNQTKTRLQGTLTAHQAADLYRCFLLDTFRLMQRVKGVQPVVAYTPDEAQAYFRALVPQGFALTAQVGHDLSERLDNVLGHWLEQGYEQALALDSDSPTLPPSYVADAFQTLDERDVDVVLGPCQDGGYYLVGIKARRPALFRGIQMSTDSVLQETVAAAVRERLRVHLLPTWYDVDTPADLERLKRELEAKSDGVAPATRRLFLSEKTDDGV
jgi:hypothetical protein